MRNSSRASSVECMVVSMEIKRIYLMEEMRDEAGWECARVLFDVTNVIIKILTCEKHGRRMAVAASVVLL